MATKLTRDVIESSLHCRYKGHLKLAGERGSPTDYEQLMRESRERVRLAATAQLLARHKEDEVLRGASVTPAVLRRGMPLLLDATVEDEEFCLRFDALQRTAGCSPLRVCLQTVSSCHCEELKATKQSRFRAEIASLRSQ